MGHTGTYDLMQSLIELLKDLDYVKEIVKVSMDGPNVSSRQLGHSTKRGKCQCT